MKGMHKGIEFSPLQRSILALVDGKRSIIELVDHVPDARPFDVLRSLYVLWFIGILKKNGSIRQEKEPEKIDTEKNNKMWSLENVLMFSRDRDLYL